MENQPTGFWRSVGNSLGFTSATPNEGISEQREDALVVEQAIVTPTAIPTRINSVTVSPNKAMSLVSVYRSVSILSGAVEQMSLDVYRNDAVIDSPALIKSPSLDITRAAFLQQSMTSLALYGNTYWLLSRAGANEAVQDIEVLNPALVTIELDDRTGRVKNYRYGDKSYPLWRIKHLKLIRVPGSYVGLGPIQAAQASLVGATDLRDYANNWFYSGGVPSGVLKSDQVLNQIQSDAIKERFLSAQSAHGVAVLGQGLNYQPIYLSPKDAQFIESQQWTKTDIATLFGVPALYLHADAGNNQSYSNQQQVDIAFMKFTVSKYMREIEDALSELLPRGQVVKFNPESLLRTDTKSRYEGHALALANGWMTTNEVRAIEGLPAISGGDVLAPKPAAPVAPVANKEVAQ